MSLLSKINSSLDLKDLSSAERQQLAKEIRNRLIEVTSKNGGHIGPNLGVVELTIALHTVFETPKDSFTFDVSHQGYVHKMLTGRNGVDFEKIRQTDGCSGFLNRAESVHDSYGAGHAGTALSAALGMASARDMAGNDCDVVAVLGDAAFTCGITLEAMNNISSHTKKLILIINDNKWSIAKNVGAISRYFNDLITNPLYNRFHLNMGSFLKKIPGGSRVIEMVSRWKVQTKDFFVRKSSLFEKLGLRYLGPIDGHNVDDLVKYLQFCKQSPNSVVLHINTVKGKGYDVAIKNPEKFHGCSPFDIATGQSKPTVPTVPNLPKWQDIFGKALVQFAKNDLKVVGITAAMPSGTGLDHLEKEVPKQFFDVGIAEEHAVLFAAGLATQGFHPVCAIYSTFLQRAFDPIIHDVCLQNLPVLFCLDRAGLSPNDGATHHGLFDIAYLRLVPNTIIAQPKDDDELVDLMNTGLLTKRPFFIRYPRGSALGVKIKDVPTKINIGEAEVIEEGKEIALWSLGNMVEEAKKIAKEIKRLIGIKITVVNARFVKPLDESLLRKHSEDYQLIISLEDGTEKGGFGSGISEYLQTQKTVTRLLIIGWPDHFVDHGNSVSQLRSENQLSTQQITNRIQKFWNKVISTS